MVPVMIGMTIAYAFTDTMAMNVFDVLLEFKNFPFLPTLGNESNYSLKAKDIMTKNFLYLTD
jgi:hypothetical protein